MIFDCDGVLVDSEPISNGVLVEMTNELGGSINMSYAMKHFKGKALKKCIEHITELVEIQSANAFETEFRRRSYQAFREGIRPIKSVEAIIKSLKIPYCVASSGPMEKIEMNLQLTGLLHYFKNRIYSCYSIKKWKPDPAVFIWAAKELNLTPEDCLVVEDSHLGIQAAKNGGFKVCAYNPDNDESLTSIADFSIDDMLKLELVLRN